MEEKIAAKVSEKLEELKEDVERIFEEPVLTPEMEEELSNGKGEEPNDAQ